MKCRSVLDTHFHPLFPEITEGSLNPDHARPLGWCMAFRGTSQVNGADRNMRKQECGRPAND